MSLNGFSNSALLGDFPHAHSRCALPVHTSLKDRRATSQWKPEGHPSRAPTSEYPVLPSPLSAGAQGGQCFVEPTRQPWPLKGFPGALSGCFTKRSVGEQGLIFSVGSAGSCHTSRRPPRPGHRAPGWVLSGDTHGVLRQAQKVVLGFFLR